MPGLTGRCSINILDGKTGSISGTVMLMLDLNEGLDSSNFKNNMEPVTMGYDR